MSQKQKMYVNVDVLYMFFYHFSQKKKKKNALKKPYETARIGKIY